MTPFQGNAGPEKSRKLKELIEAQMRRLQPQPQPTFTERTSEKEITSELVTVMEEKSEDECCSVVCGEGGPPGTPRTSLILKKKMTNNSSMNPYQSGASKGLYCMCFFWHV